MNKTPISIILSLKTDAHCWKANVNSAKLSHRACGLSIREALKKCMREACKKNGKINDIYQKRGLRSEFYENNFFCNCDIRGLEL